MLDSYFQKVKRNLGTFKAFGMRTSELIKVYLVIMLRIVFTSVLWAMLLAIMIQLIMPFCGLQRDGGFDYLSLFCWEFWGSIVAVLAATIITVCVQMNRLLTQTPGDLIYDR
jgi:ABC-type dipeptide/oligopeptide/nickel transport system permease component